MRRQGDRKMGNRNAPLIFLLCLTGRVWLGQSATAQAQTPTNLALSKPATQADVHAWWQVDLGGVASLQTVQLWNRTDCCGDRLNAFYVFVSDGPFNSTDLTTTLSQPGVSNYYTAGVAGTSTVLTINRT